jgi:hypothetical protein
MGLLKKFNIYKQIIHFVSSHFSPSPPPLPLSLLSPSLSPSYLRKGTKEVRIELIE